MHNEVNQQQKRGLSARAFNLVTDFAGACVRRALPRSNWITVVDPCSGEVTHMKAPMTPTFVSSEEKK